MRPDPVREPARGGGPRAGQKVAWVGDGTSDDTCARYPKDYILARTGLPKARPFRHRWAAAYPARTRSVLADEIATLVAAKLREVA